MGIEKFVAVLLTPQALTLFAHCRSIFRRLTFELSGSQRQDARPGPLKMCVHHRPGPGGLPLALRLSEGLGSTFSPPPLEHIRICMPTF